MIYFFFYSPKLLSVKIRFLIILLKTQLYAEVIRVVVKPFCISTSQIQQLFLFNSITCDLKAILEPLIKLYGSLYPV